MRIPTSKWLAERILYAIGLVVYVVRLHRAVMWLTRRIPKVVLYHAVDPKEEDPLRDPDANVPPSQFARHLDFYARHYEVVSIDRICEKDLPPFALAITFDDGYRSVIDYAVPELKARALPATVYVVPAVIGNPQLIWVNELNWLARRYPVDTARAFVQIFGVPVQRSFRPREIIDHVCAHFSSDRIRQMLDTIQRSVGGSSADLARQLQPYLDWEDVKTLADAGITIGNHTWSHPSLPRLTPSEQMVEITRAAAALNGQPNWSRSFAYPFGHSDATARHAAVQAGHRTVCEVGGINLPLRPERVARVPIRRHLGPAGLFAELEVVGSIKGLANGLLRSFRVTSKGGDAKKGGDANVTSRS